jgi:hypothetical protein
MSHAAARFRAGGALLGYSGAAPFSQVFSEHGHMHQILRTTLRVAVWALVASSCLLGPALADSGTTMKLGSQFTPAAERADLIDQFIACFAAGPDPKSGGQVVLHKDTAWCDGDGDRDPRYNALKDSSLLDWISPNPCGGQGVDYRRLDSDLIKDIVAKNDIAAKNDVASKKDASPRIKESGIRIIGAAFCSSEIDLSDIDIPYSIVLDYSLFKFGLRVKNFKTAGNFSIDYSVVFANFVLYDAEIGQDLYATYAFIRYLTLQAAQVDGSVYLNHSLITNSINLLGAVIKGSVEAKGTATSDFVISSSSEIAGELNLSGAEARCSYQLQPSALGQFVAETVGFGQVSADNVVDWVKAETQDRIATFMTSAAIQKVATEYNTCKYSDPWTYVFLVSGTTMKSFCLANFYAFFPQVPKDQNSKGQQGKDQSGKEPVPVPGATIRINGATVSDSFILNAGSDSTQNRSLQMLEVDSPVFVFNFAGFPSTYESVIDGFHFKRVYAWTNAYSCGLAGKKDDWQVPATHHVIGWLQTNKSPSLQPYVTIAASFDDAGRDSTPIKVDKGWTELRNAFRDQYITAKNAWSTGSLLWFVFWDGPIIAIDYLRSGLNWIFGFFLDFGFRPAKSIFLVVGIVLAAWIYFNLWLGIFAFVTKGDQKVKFVGPVFLFDHLIPALKLSEDNYDVENYLVKPTKDAKPKTERERFVFNPPINAVAASERQVAWANRCLLVLKVLGFVLAAFLLAAINALVNH